MELTSRHINLIRWDIRQNGIYQLALQEDVLDHMCCLLEKEFETTRDFKTAYLKVRNQMGPLKRMQCRVDEELITHKRLERFVKIPNYIAVTIYLLLGIGMLFGPLFLSIVELNPLFSVLALPLLVMGYVIIFRRINYRKWDIIPYKESFSPVQITF